VRRTTTARWCAAACLALVGCTPGPGPDGPTTPVTDGSPTAVATTPVPRPSAPTASAAPPAVLVRADGTVVDGPVLDLGAARRVRLGTDVTHVRDVPAEPGTRSSVEDLRPDGSFLVRTVDAAPSGDGGGTLGALREVTADGVRTLHPPADDDVADRLVAGDARRVDAGIAWVEPYGAGDENRLVLVPHGSSRARVVVPRSAGDDRVTALARWGAVLADGRVVGWDSAVTGTPAPPGTDLRHTPAGDDVVETRCDLTGCELALLTEGGRREVVLRGPAGTWAVVSDGRHLVVRVEDGATTWGVDMLGGTAVRIVGELFPSSMSDGRAVVEDGRGVVVVDLVDRAVERLGTGEVVTVAIAADLVALGALGHEGAGADGDGGDVLRWPRR